jgi:predicted permease
VSLSEIFVAAILPIVGVAAMGFALGRYRDVSPDALNTVTVYVLAPALVVHTLATTDLGGGTITRIVVAVVLGTLSLIALSALVGRLAGQPEPLFGAFVLTSAFANVGNYGIPLADFAFGPVGRSTAVLVTAVSAVLMYTVGVYVAARGGDRSSLGSMRRALGVPLIYAVVVALIARRAGVVPPADGTLMQTLEILGNASIPVMLLILGIQLSSVSLGGELRAVGLATFLKLVVAPAVAVAVVVPLGFTDPTVARVVVLLLATPSAVTSVILVGAFSDPQDGVDPGAVVSATVFVTTLVSIVTVTLLVSLLQTGTLV